jgi:hypothetical protein
MRTLKTKFSFYSVFFAAITLLTACEIVTDQTRPKESILVVKAPLVDYSIDESCDAQDIINLDKNRVIALANSMLSSEPRTVSADLAERSAGGPNDFFSEGDYWWPVPGQPDAPYEVKDGQTNPNNFVAHRLSMLRLADHIGALVSAWTLTKDKKYADAANVHLRAWFVNPKTRMLPRLLYAQAITGRHTGRSIGLIDTLHLVEVARGAKILIDSGALLTQDAVAVKSWFGTYATWMNTHPYGIEERDWYNNHSIAWSLQVAAFSDLVGDEVLMDLVREKFKTIYLPDMMDETGGFPKELSRTKPYGYAIFVLDLMAGIATIASTETDNLWKYQTQSGRSMALGVSFLAPYIANKGSWPYAKDIQYWDDWPVRQPFLLQGGLALNQCELIDLASNLAAASNVYEVRRNWPLRSPLLWLAK